MKPTDQAEENPDPEQLRHKVKEYATFVEQTLHPELKLAVKAREEIESEIAEYEELQTKLVLLQKRPGDEPLESMVNLGHEMVYCRAIVNDPHTVFVHVGMGFHVEFTLTEALLFIDKRLQFLRDDVLTKRVERAKTVANHLESALLLLEQLGKELRLLEGG